MMMKTIAVKTEYVRANEGYNKLIQSVESLCEDNDYLFISETPISTAEGNLVDEADFKAGLLATFLTEVWGRYLWGYVLGPLLGCKKRTIQNLRRMPKQARNHKELILRRYGLKHALQPTAEAGVDLSNVSSSYASLLPENPQKSACIIKKIIEDDLNININVVIMDTDATYSIFNHKFTTLPIATEGICSNLGIIGYLGGFVSKKLGPTILATTTGDDLDRLIEMANLAEKTQVYESDNFFETVYNMTDSFGGDYSEITDEMLSTLVHIPAVLIRGK